MAFAPPPVLNGRPRKQLSDQLDRLDEVINGMEEYLPQAVADAARDGIRQAFRDVMSELIRDPEVLDKLRAAIPPETGPVVTKPSAFARLKAVLKAAARRTASAAVGAIAVAAAVPRRIATTALSSIHRLKLKLAGLLMVGLPLPSILTVSLVTGVTVAVISFVVPQHVAAVISGICASTTAMGLQVARWVRRQMTMAF